jgi:hypothetical protein
MEQQSARGDSFPSWHTRMLSRSRAGQLKRLSTAFPDQRKAGRLGNLPHGFQRPV